MSRLDRLSALLEGLKPSVKLVSEPTGFGLNIFRHHPDSIDPQEMQLLVSPNESGFIKARAESGNLVSWMCFEVDFRGPIKSVFLEEFNQALWIPMNEAEPSLTAILSLVAGERAQERCGQPLLLDRAGEILLIAVLRHMVAQPYKDSGIFSALAHPQIARSVVAMHNEIRKPWSIESLADVANMSRTAFSTKFKKTMQVSPGKYLELLRLSTAKQLLHEGNTLKVAADKTGYSCAATLSRALARTH